MKAQIHPAYHVTEVSCGCGASFVTRSTKPTIKLEICSSCHPFYTGRQKFVDTAGRVEKFTRKFGWTFDQSTGEGGEAAKVEKKAVVRANKEEGERETFKSLAKKTKKALADGAKRQLAAKAQEAEGAAAAAEGAEPAAE